MTDDVEHGCDVRLRITMSTRHIRLDEPITTTTTASIPARSDLNI